MPMEVLALYFSPKLLAVEHINSSCSECLVLSLIPAEREMLYIPQINKLGFGAVQAYLFLERLILLVLVSVLHQIQVMYFSAASYSFCQLYPCVLSSHILLQLHENSKCHYKYLEKTGKQSYLGLERTQRFIIGKLF